MRNLKKVLSLVLCLAVMLSVMVVGAGAAFSDQDKIENTEAVDACSALNIINGYEDGAFHPERNIKRAEVTKMICVALNGGTEPNTSTGTDPIFSDVRGTVYAWAEGYIEACHTQGIVDGVGGTRFAPASNVTAAQLAKMLLVSLGYDAETEKFTGNTWETNVNVRASQKHLYDGLEKMDTSAPVTRDQAAQMVWNAMQAYVVEYKDGVLQDKVVGSNNDKITLLRDRYDAWIYVGTLTSVDSTNITISMSKADQNASDPQYTTTTGGSTSVTVDFSKLKADYSSMLGQKVKVLFKDGKTNNVIGVYATSDNTVYTVNANEVEKDGQKVKFNGKSYSLKDNKINAYVTTFDGNTTAAASWTSADFNDLDRSASIMKFVDSDSDGKLDAVIVTEYTAAKVTYASSTQIVAGGETYKFADENIQEGIAKDDWAVISYDRYGDCQSIVKADLIKDKLSATKKGTLSDKTTYDQYQINGTWYNAANDKNADLKSVKAGDNVEAVAVNGVLFYVKRTSSSTSGEISDVAMILGTDKVVGTNKASIALFDGTKKEVTIDSDTKVAMTPGSVYEYSVSDGEYTFTNLLTGSANKEYYGDFTAYDSNFGAVKGQTNESITIDGSTYKIADNAKVLLYADGDREYITGKQFKNLTLDSDSNTKVLAAFVGDMDGLTRVGALAVAVKTLPNDLDTNDNYAYILNDASKTGNNQVSYYIWTGTEMINVVEEYSGSLNNRQAGLVIGYKSIDTEKNNLIDDVDLKKVNVASIESKADNDKTLNVVSKLGTDYAAKNNAAAYGEHDIADATVIYVNSDNSFDAKEEEGGNIGVKAGSPIVSDYASTLFLLNGDDFELVVIDVKGKFVDSPYVLDTAAPALTAGDVDGTNPSYGEVSKKATVEITPKNFAVKGGSGTDKDNIVDNAVKVVIKDSKSVDQTTKFTVTKADLTKNGVSVEQGIQNNGADAGEYTATFTAGGESVDVKFTVEKAELATVNAATIEGGWAATAPANGQVLGQLKNTKLEAAANQGYVIADTYFEVNDLKVSNTELSLVTGQKVEFVMVLKADDNHKVVTSSDYTTAAVNGVTPTVAVNETAGTITVTFAWASIS